MTDPVLVVLVLAVAIVLGAIWSFNRFVAQVASLDASWAGIAVELQRRHDLVPRIVETAAGYARHEQRVLVEVTRARERAVAAEAVPDQARAEDRLTEGLTGLFALAEDFPELESDRLFRDLQRQLIETEDRIAAARRLYNLDVAAYERRRQAVPSSVVASTFRFGPRPSFEVIDAAAVHAAHIRL